MIRLLAALLGAALLALVASPAHAHDFSPGALVLEEQPGGHWRVLWREPIDVRGNAGAVVVRYPEPCRPEPAGIRCGHGGLRGELAFDGLHGRGTQVVVSVQRLDGQSRQWLVRSEAPLLRLDEGTAAPWLDLGWQNALRAAAPLAFALAFALLLGAGRALLASLYAFQLANAAGLALAAFAGVRPPSAALDVTLALGLVLLAAEVLRPRHTWTRRVPWAMAALLGLACGLALAIGPGRHALPPEGRPATVVVLGLAIALGQLAIVAALHAAARLSRARVAWPTRATAWALGAAAAACVVDRACMVVAAASRG